MYCIDTSSLIHLWERAYPIGSFPKLYERLEALVVQGRLCTTDEVRVELEKKSDGVIKWAKTVEGFFIPLDQDIQVNVTQILGKFPDLLGPKIARSGADPFVVALASIKDATVITEEHMGTATKPKIPNVCASLKLQHGKLLDLIVKEKWVF